MRKTFNTLFFLLILASLSVSAFGRGGHSTLDLVDPSFNPQVQTNLYGSKWVNEIQSLPDGKILALGNFNSYNNVRVGKLIRINPNGSLDTTFNNQIVTDIRPFDPLARIFIQPDGKIILRCEDLIAGGHGPRKIIRLNADGTLDTTFNYIRTETINVSAMDSLGRVVLMGDFTTPNGARRIVRLNGDGSLDNSFDFQLSDGATLKNIAVQGSRIIVGTQTGSEQRIYRLNENGSTDSSFTPLAGSVSLLSVQPTTNKALYLENSFLLRANENGGNDGTFQPTETDSDFGVAAKDFKFTSDGKLVNTVSVLSSTKIRRYLANGGIDASFSQYAAANKACFTVQPDDGVIVADGMHGVLFINNYVRLTPTGTPDATFNQGNVGFQNLTPGLIEAIETQTNGKILLGGRFALINGISRVGLARLNSDSTVDTTFQVNMTGSGNYFTFITDVYQIRALADGKMLVSGYFDYVLGGVTKQNIVRLNADGSIDPTFNLTYQIPDWSYFRSGGQNKFTVYNDGKLMIASSRFEGLTVNPGPTKLTAGGAYDSSFSPLFGGQSPSLNYDDIAIQPDGKIIAAGSYLAASVGFVSHIARFNTDGSLDSTFLYAGETGRRKSRLILLPNGKILHSQYLDNGGAARLQRLNSNGSVDNSFNTLTITDPFVAKINALLLLADGKIFVGGKFTLTVNGRQYKNLLRLSADGSIETTSYNVDDEVLCLTLDGEGRLLVGGKFSVIGANGDNVNRSYVARLTDSNTRFDFDGDGRSDLSVFTPQNGKWTIHNSNANQTSELVFGLSGDKLAAADYDGDGKSDIAVYRPSNGVWYLWRSREGFSAIQWGASEDKPVAADYDGDGLADIAVWRPSNRGWYIRKSSDGQLFAVQFGLSDDIPLADADFDGDGKADIAVWRPSTGIFYWLASGSGNQFRAVQFGSAGDVPVVGDYNGDGKTDLVVFRPSEGNWYQYLSAPNGNYTFAVFNFGINGDEPVAADYNGDGKTDIAVRRQNVWHINRSEQGYIYTAFANANDLAVASSLSR